MWTCCDDIRVQVLKIAEGEREVGEGDNVETLRIANCRITKVTGCGG